MYSFLKGCILVVTIFLTAGAQAQVTKNYEKEWKKVDNLAKKNLPKSALEEVKKIYAKAKAQKQDAQIIKALIYFSGLQSENRENNEMFSVKELEDEIAISKEPVSSILKSLLAELYWSYFQNNRWKFYNRTQTEKFNKTDMTTWDAEDFHKKITELHLQAIKNEKLLQQTKLEEFDAVIIKGNTRQLRPTLYDMLAHRAVDYFANDERDIAKPAYAFEINQSAAFDPAADFINRKFTTNDSFSLHHKAILIYQKLLAFHLKDPKPDALIDADINRIEFVKNYSVHPDKEQLYFNALNHIANQYRDNPAAAQASYLMARYYNNLGVQYRPFLDTTNRYAKVKAKEICEKVLTQKTESEGWVNCYNLLNELEYQSYNFKVEKVNLPGQPFRALVNYKNIGSLYLRVLKLNEQLKKQLEDRSDDKYWTILNAAPHIKSWKQDLPSTNDLQNHNTEIKIDGLEAGEYILYASSDNNFIPKKSKLGARQFYVSMISHINNGDDYFILNRDSGKPLPGAEVQIWEYRYDYNARKNTINKGKLYKTDANGYFRLERPKKENNNYNNYNYSLDITYNKERLYTEEYQAGYYYSDDTSSTDTKNVYLFTDRSIYRPGQTLYFKGISLILNNKNVNRVLANKESIIYLRDANMQVIDSLKLTSNDYGSFSGKFQLPSSGLNGLFSLFTNNITGSANFRVEEYKRPKFSVDYEPIKGTYKLNDKIKITGIAKAYAGNNIDGANVKYRVIRQARFLYPWLRKMWMPPSTQMEIAHGEIKTDKEGKFYIEFTAIPDLKVDKRADPVFDYTVYADVTDASGETRSGEKSVTAGYKSLILKTNFPEIMIADSLSSLSIHTENMNGVFEPASVKVIFTKLKEENRLIRNRYWERQDQFTLTKQEYIKFFPYDEYDNESDYKSWQKGGKVFEQTDSSKENWQWQIKGSRIKPGFYEIEISTRDNNGEEVKDIKFIELYDDKSKQLSNPEYLWTGVKKTIVEPDEHAIIETGTSADNLFFIQQVKKKGQSQETGAISFITMNNEKKTFSFPATEADRGGYAVRWAFVKHNRYYQLLNTIAVPWTNKDLNIEYSTFREKTLPGSEEKWKIKITGNKKEKMAAEMLASMYDASLDQFYPHNWNEPSVWNSYTDTRPWTGYNNFAQVNSFQSVSTEKEYRSFNKQYDYLLASYVFSPYYRNSTEPLWWMNPLDYAYGEFRNPRLMRLPKRGEEMMQRTPLPYETLASDDVASFRGNNYQSLRKDGGFDFSLNADGVIDQFDKKEQTTTQPRRNFNETAFFLPDLRTNENGDIEFSFTMPEALTKWKFQVLAHTKDLAFGYSSKEIITQKDLMVQPNPPRFLREGDKIEFSAKIVNLTDKEITGETHLLLFDAETNEPVDAWFRSAMPNQYFTVAPGQSEAVKFPLEIPFQYNKALTWRITASSGNKSDGEENSLPVLTNRMLVTESMPINMKGTGTKDFKFEKLLKSESSTSLQHHAVTVEYTTNPVWYAVQALPYLMEYPYECAEQTWNRYYANALASMITNSSPRIKQVFESWKTKDTTALISNLQKNQELKAVLQEETPWVLQAKSETQQKKNIALLFDLVRMSNELNSTYEKLKQMQSSNGGFVWFKGGPDNAYITQYIITGIGHLKKLGVDIKKLNPIIQNAIPYLDKRIKEEYDNLKKIKTDLKSYVPDHYELQYLYMRSFFPEIKIAAASQTAYEYFLGRAQNTWTKQGKYMQGMIALTSYRANDLKTPAAILKSLKETSIINEELGMYWKELSNGGYYWHQAPVETQALLIEAFSEAGKDTKTVDDLKTWLLKNKQTTNWKTTKATAEACYALLLQGTKWQDENSTVEIKLGNSTFKSTDNTVEAGTGYFKKTIEGIKVNPDMGNISVTLKSQSVNQSTSWGSVYWQYFEDLDKITPAETPLKLSKKLFVEKNTDRGPVLTPVNEGDYLKVGDKIKVRIELRVDRDMEYVHMKDMRASAMEPVNVLSSYKWQGGLGYYETTKDASTNFFFDYIRKGTYVFEYPLFVTNTGNFSNGVTTIQCMYAPEFTAHSEGVRVNVE